MALHASDLLARRAAYTNGRDKSSPRGAIGVPPIASRCRASTSEGFRTETPLLAPRPVSLTLEDAEPRGEIGAPSAA